jgi:hypothetical protein
MSRGGGIFGLSGGSDLWDNGLGGEILSADYFAPAPPPVGSGLIKVDLSGEWVEKPVKAYLSGVWVTKPLRRRSGSSWV